MAFVKKTWVDRVVEKPYNRKLKNISTLQETEYEVSRVEGDIVEEGDKFNAATMNNVETRIEDAFDSLATVAKTNDYNDLNNKPSLSGLSGRKTAPYTEGAKILYEDPKDILYKPADGSVYSGEIAINKYKDDAESVSTAIVLKDSGSFLFNFDITPTKTTYWTDNADKMGAKIEFVDGSHIYVKPTFVAGIFTGFKFSNGKIWQVIFETGDFPDFE